MNYAENMYQFINNSPGGADEQFDIRFIISTCMFGADRFVMGSRTTYSEWKTLFLWNIAQIAIDFPQFAD